MSLLDKASARRIRFIVRVSFLVLILAVVLLPYFALRWQKERSYASHSDMLDARGRQLGETLLNPAWLFVFSNPARLDEPATPLRLAVLPYETIRIDDPWAVRDLLDAIGCHVRITGQARVCAAVGKGDEKELQRIYLTGSFLAPNLRPQLVANGGTSPLTQMQSAHRLRIDLVVGGKEYGWLLVVRAQADGKPSDGFRLATYRIGPEGDQPRTQKAGVMDARIVQKACLDAPGAPRPCLSDAAFAVRIDRAAWRALTPREAQAPTVAELKDVRIRLRVMGPEPQTSALLDTNSPSRVAFARKALEELLQPGETITVNKRVPLRGHETVATVSSREDPKTEVARLGDWVLDFLPADGKILETFEMRDKTFWFGYKGTFKSVDAALAENATSYVVYGLFMLTAIIAVWMTIELGVVRRVLRLTKRTADLSQVVLADGDIARFDLSDLRGRDELGVLASGIDDLRSRIADDLRRKRDRIKHEEDVLHAIGHEIRSPLQGLSAVVDKDDDRAQRYIQRMLQALKTLYGNASPAEALEQATIHDERVDVALFLRSVARNALGVGIAGVELAGADQPTWVRADEAGLEDAITHVLTNATRYRLPESPISISLSADESKAVISVHNRGPRIPEDMLDRIFSYGVSDSSSTAAEGHRGQGLFVAKTYMVKMGGTISAANVGDGVTFQLRLPMAQRRINPPTPP